MRTSERVRCSRFPVGSAALKSPADVGRSATATDSVPRIVFLICVLAVVARLIFINQPYVDHWSWRQSDVAAIALNFLQNGFRFGYPQIDWAGDAPGYVGTEFPILPFIAAVCDKFAGVHEWIGRIQAVILFAVSLPFFFLLVRAIFGSRAAVWASSFFCFTPLNVFAGRSFMPDVPSLSFAIIGLYFFLRWIGGHNWAPLFLSAIAISLSLLIKITSIIIVAPLVYLVCADMSALSKAATCRRIPKLLLFFAIALLPPAIWYWHAHQIAQEFYPHHFFGAGGIRIEHFSWYWHIAQQTLISSFTPVLSLMALIGFLLRRDQNTRDFLLVADCDSSFRHRRRLWQSPPVVSTSAGPDRLRVCRRCLRLCRLENLVACDRGDIVGSAREFVHDPCVLVCSTVLPIICGATS